MSTVYLGAAILLVHAARYSDGETETVNVEPYYLLKAEEYNS